MLQGNLHILNAMLPEPPAPMDTATQPTRSSSLSKGLTRVLSGLKEALPTSRSSPPAPNPAAPAEASKERPVTFATVSCTHLCYCEVCVFSFNFCMTDLDSNCFGMPGDLLGTCY